jgi:N-acetyl-alpha-D-glucosaminyl L-malate synthase BshA
MARRLRPLRVAISCYPTFGGSGVVATELGIALADRGHRVHFISYAQPQRLREFHERITYHEVDVATYPLFKYPPYDLALASKMIEVAASHGLDLVHVHYAIPHAISAYLAREMIGDRKLKVVTTLHGTDITLVGNNKAYFPATRFGIQRSDAVTAVSDYLKRETIRTFGVGHDVVVVPNFVDTQRFRPDAPAARKKSFRRRGERVLAHVSNFRPVKRIADVIHVFALVARKMPARLLMIGDGPELPNAERLVDELGLRERVEFFGLMEAVEAVLPQADLFLLPSEFESFGLAALEAMACGVPVIVTETGGTGEVVEHGVGGYLCRVGDIECMAQTALDVFSDPALLRRLKRSARLTAVRRFRRDRVVQRYEEVYRGVLRR